MRLLVTVILCAGLSGIVMSAPPVMDPELDYIGTPDQVLVNWGIVRSRALLRLELDLEGSGKKSVFLIYQGNVDRSGRMWTAYLARDKGGYDRAPTGVQFRDDLFHAGKLPKLNPTGGVLGLWPFKINPNIGKGGGTLFRYRLIDQDMKLQKVKDLDYADATDLRIFKSLFGRLPDEQNTTDRSSLFKSVPVSEVEGRCDLQKAPAK